MKLLYQAHSPFARKVLVFAHEADLAERRTGLAVCVTETDRHVPSVRRHRSNCLALV